MVGIPFKESRRQNDATAPGRWKFAGLSRETKPAPEYTKFARGELAEARPGEFTDISLYKNLYQNIGSPCNNAFVWAEFVEISEE